MKYDSLPHDETIEKGLFGALLFLPDRFAEVADALAPSDFYVTSHQQLWQAMTDLLKDGKPIDFPNLRMQLKKQDTDPKAALEALSEAIDENTQYHHVTDFVKEIKNKSLLRQIIKMSKVHAYSGQVEDASAPELLATIEKDLLAILDKTTDASPVDANGIISEVQSDIDKGIKEGWKGYSTGFAQIDKPTGGFIPSQIWIIGAYTGTGKTFLMLQMMLNVLRKGGRVVLFSTEMDRKLNMLRILGNIAELGTIQMMRNQLNDEQIESLKKAQDEVRGFGDRLIIYDNVNTVEQLRLKTKKLQLAKGIDIVVIDYIQQLKEKGSIYEQMSTVASDLQRMALELKTTLIIGSQVSQAAAGWQSKEAIEFKGAGEIAAIADIAIWIKKIDDRGGREILLRKVRHGAPVNLENVQIKFPSGRIVDLNEPSATDENHDIKGQL